ncbi:hypothetical protein PENTCL1PPCAC_24874, partial [Pristionchus entomophagus]
EFQSGTGGPQRMIRRESMSILQAMMEEMEQEQARDNPLRRSIAVDQSIDAEEAEENEGDPPDLPTSPRPELVESVHASLSDE